ncbi:MAG: NAD(P)H-binding protein [Actinocatenispora sp.]
MDTVLVTGANGHLGRKVLDLLKGKYRIRAMARRPPGAERDVEWVAGDLATGGGIREAMTGANLVVHAATLSPAAQRGYPRPGDFRHSPTDVDVEGTQRLLDEAERVGIEHFLHVSVVGAAHPRRGYLGVKHLAEDAVRAAGTPWSILRATPFHWLVDRMLTRAARLPALPVPADLPVQPADHADFAQYLVDCLGEGPGRQRQDFGGPDILRLGELVRQWSEVRRRSLRLVGLPTPARLSAAAADFTCPNGRLGTTSWSAWLRTAPTG